jgi:NADH dehydrogenase (ubiquinone) Fe-S protein 6
MLIKNTLKNSSRAICRGLDKNKVVLCRMKVTEVPNEGNEKAGRNSPYDHGIFRSNAEKLVNQVPVIEVNGHTAVCDGGSGALGHPIEYIQLDTVSDKPAVCKYCGLRFKMKHH